MFSFGPFQLYPAAVRLTRNGIDLEVEPQVFNTLLLLICNRERVVSKDELLEKIWQGRVVTDHVITRIIYELRKILDDKSSTHSSIRTVRGKGYQFIAEVTETQEINDSEDLNEESDTTEVRPSLMALVLIVGLLLLSAILFMVLKPAPNASKTSSLVTLKQHQNRMPIIAVLPIEVKFGNMELSMLVQSLIDYLTSQLALTLNMKVIHPDSLINLKDKMDNIWAIQKATRSDYIIKGFIESKTNQSVFLHLTLYKNNGVGEMTPFPLGAFEFPYPKNSQELKDLYKQRKLTVRSIVKIIKPGVTVNDDGNSETEDPEAYRLVIAAYHMSRSDDCKDMERAEQLLLAAVAIDENFVYAYQQLFSNYYKRVWICGESTEYHKKGLEMAKIVDRLAPNLHSAMDIRRSTILVESNQVEEAFEFSKDADWNSPESIYDEAYSLRYAGFLNVASKNIDRILQLDPFFFNEKPIQQAPNTLLYQNRFSEHLALLAEPGNSYHDYFRGLNLFLSDQVSDAQSILQGVIERTPNDFFGKFSQALLHVIQNDNSAAIDVINEIVKQRSEMKHTDGEMTYKVVQLFALAGAKNQALKHLQITVNQGFFPMNYFLNDPALQSIQDSEKFTFIIEEATRRHEAFAERFGLMPETKVEITLK